jgi:hypothetical protein
MKNLYIIILFVCCLININLKSEQVVPDAYYNFVKHEYQLNDDGSIVYHYEHNLKLLSYMSFNRLFGESFITYNSDWQELKIIKAETKSSSGEIIKSPFNAFNKVLPGEVGQATTYMNLREMVVTHTGLERNAEIAFEYSLTSKKGFYPGLIGKITIGSHEPIKYFEIVIKVPKDSKINLFMSNNGPMGEKSTHDNFDFYTWKLYDIPLIPVESNQPNMELFLPTLYISTATNSDIVRHLDLENNQLFELSSKAKDVCNEIIKNQFSFQDKCFALRNYIFQNIGQTNIEITYLGWKTKKAQETFDRNVGSKLDRAILLIAMCRAVGINAEIAVTTNFSNAKPDLSLLSQWGEYLVYCTSDNTNDFPLLLDPNNNQNSILPKSISKKTTFVVNPQKISLIPATDEPGKLTLSLNLKLTNESTEGLGKISVSGDYMPDFEYEKCNKTINGYFNALGWTTENKGKDKFSLNEFSENIKIKKIHEKMLDDIIELELPFISPQLQKIELIPVTRVTPFGLTSLIDEEYNIKIELPNNLKNIFTPKELNISNPVGSLSSTVKNDKNTIEIHRKIKIAKQYIAPEDYHYLYELISAWKNKYHNNVYVK